MNKSYPIVSKDAQSASKSIQEFARANGQILLPLVELITQARVAVDEVIQTIGRQAIKTTVTLSAQEVADPRAPGKLGGEIRWHGLQRGRGLPVARQTPV